MDLKKFLPGKESSEPHEYFWSIVVEPGWVQAGIWRIEGKKARVVISSSAYPWETDEDLVGAADSVLTSAIQGFPEDLTEPQKTVFGLSAKWVTKGDIKEEYLAKIKKLCTELSLTPIGFVVVAEALSHYKKLEEGSPLNGVLVGLYKESLEITLFKLGTLAGTAEVARSVSVGDDVTEGLSRLIAKDNVPSRFILYNAKEGELEEARQVLLKVNWEDYPNLKFLHTPKVEIIDAKTKVYAISLAGASEMTEITEVEVMEESEKVDDSKTHLGKVMVAAAAADEASEIGNVEALDESVTPESIGFFRDEDVGTSDQKTQSEAENEGGSPSQGAPHQEEVHDSSEVGDAPGPKVSRFPSKFRLKERLAFLPLFFNNILSKLKLGKGPQNKAFGFGIIFLLIFFIGGFLWWWFYPKATVTIYVSPQTLEEEITFTVDTTSDESNLSENTLAGELLETSVSGEKTKDTTGTKTVGDKAKGEITLYRVGTELTLDEGTVVSGPENLKFTLDNETTIASGSASTPGTATGAVTAQEFGAEYNLSSGSSFTISNYSTADIEAKNTTSFSGGSSRDIRAVSEEDQEVLKGELLAELTSNALEELKSSVPSDQFLIEDSVVVTPTEEVYSNKVGDEADSLKLSMEVDAQGVSVNKDELTTFATEALSGKVPEGFVVRGDQIDFELESMEEGDDGTYEFTFRVSANLLPEIDTLVLASQIRGKYPELAREYLMKEAPGFVRTEITIKPSLPAKIRTLPRVVGNIEVVIAAEQ